MEEVWGGKVKLRELVQAGLVSTWEQNNTTRCHNRYKQTRRDNG